MWKAVGVRGHECVGFLSNISVERMEEGELERVTDHYTKQLKASGYTRKECRDIVVSGELGWNRRMMRRLEENKEFYRSAGSTLRSRIKKKLLDPVRWYKPKIEDEIKKPDLKKAARPDNDEKGRVK